LAGALLACPAPDPGDTDGARYDLTQGAGQVGIGHNKKNWLLCILCIDKKNYMLISISL
jgi:hypothetical protein